MKSKVTFLSGLLVLIFAFSVSAASISVKDIGKQRIPLEPNSEIWINVTKASVGLQEQEITEPHGGGTVKSVQVQAVHNDTFIAFLLQWSDTTANRESVNKFSDAVAVQFPSNGNDDGSPFMGDEDNTVNIWQWRADWQQDIQIGFQDNISINPAVFSSYITKDSVDYPAEAAGNPAANRTKRSAVADLLAKGFGTLTYNPHQDVSGVGEYKNGKWKVILLRALSTTGVGDAQFKKGSDNYIGFAAWDGNHSERNGVKSVTVEWSDLHIE